MSVEYDLYLQQHRDGVAQAFDWLKENLPGVVEGVSEHGTHFAHDESKNNADEYEAYDRYFYGRNRSFKVVEDFNKAWLLHIHRNPHHWQHWILIHDDPGENTLLDMDYEYIIEMICDWWSFSFRKGELSEIFDWYDTRKEHIQLSAKTRKTVEDILEQIKNKLEDQKNES